MPRYRGATDKLARGPAVVVAANRAAAEAGDDTIEALRRLGHQVKDTAKDAGTAHLIALEGDAWSAAAEPRSADSGAIGA
jgi:gamma-glutamyltranspeptidase